MRAYRLFGVVAIAGLVSVAFSEQSNALTLTLDQNDTSSFPTTSIGFQAPNFTIGPTTVDFPTTSSPGEFRSPWDIEGAPHNSLPYTSVRGGTAGYNLTGNVLSLFWGSVDTYNTLTFFTGVGGSGTSAIFSTALLGLPMTTGHHLVRILTDEVFRSVTISSSQAAFEFANLTATPIPAALPLFATGLGLMGWLARRRKRGHATPIAA